MKTPMKKLDQLSVMKLRLSQADVDKAHMALELATMRHRELVASLGVSEGQTIKADGTVLPSEAQKEQEE